VAQVVERLSSKCDALSSKLWYWKKKKRKREKLSEVEFGSDFLDMTLKA
jgi:hypothetical protein